MGIITKINIKAAAAFLCMQITKINFEAVATLVFIPVLLIIIILVVIMRVPTEPLHSSGNTTFIETCLDRLIIGLGNLPCVVLIGSRFQAKYSLASSLARRGIHGSHICIGNSLGGSLRMACGDRFCGIKGRSHVSLVYGRRFAGVIRRESYAITIIATSCIFARNAGGLIMSLMNAQTFWCN